MRAWSLPLLSLLLCSCAQHGEDVALLPNRPSAPPAFMSYGGKPYLRQWADFDVYRNASVEAEKMVDWSGETAVPGQSLAIYLSEGSVLENTSAHPQHFQLWIQIPDHLPVGTPYPLRPASQWRTVTRKAKWSSDDVTRYSTLKDGEMTVSGMQGYDVPKLSSAWGSVATLTILSRSQNYLTFRLAGRLPIHEDGFGYGGYRYALTVDREYKARFKPIPTPRKQE